MGAFLQLRDLAKSFGDHRVLSGLSLDLEEGEILALLGLSGSGKTTALRLLAGFETPDEGSIRVAGDDVVGLAPAKRGFGMVFQHYALFPHMTVAENIAFGLEAQGWDAGRIAPRIQEMLELVDLKDFGSRRVSEISGGQQQRVALARALAPEPRVLLLDEPLSNLDPSLRERTRRELRAAVKRIGITTVIVTHEQEEAFHVGDRVAVLHDGHLQQVAVPEVLYRKPASRFVATFIGRASTVQGVVREVETQQGSTQHTQTQRAQTQRARVEILGARWSGVTPEGAPGLSPGMEVDVVLKPEGLGLVDAAHPGALPGTVIGKRFTGPLTYCAVDLGKGAEVEVLVASGGEISELAAGDDIFVAPRGAGPRPRLFPAKGTP